MTSAEHSPPVTSGASSPAWAVSIFVLALASWFGGAVFYSAAVLPVLFLNLAPHDAGSIAALIFPVYFRAGLVAGVVACASAWVLARSGGRRWKGALVVLLVMTAAQAWQAFAIMPEIARIRGNDAEARRFQDLHELSVRLNGVVLAGGFLLVAGSGYLLARRRDDS